MLTKNLYILCKFITNTYNNLNINSKDICFLDKNIVDTILAKQLFNFKWQKKLHHTIPTIKFNFNYKILEQNSNLIKLNLLVQKSFLTKGLHKNINSTCIENYVSIIEYSEKYMKFKLLIEKEENPTLYYNILQSNLDNFSLSSFNSIATQKNKIWTNKLLAIDSLHENYLKLFHTSRNNNAFIRSSNFNVTKACIYAETFALVSNPEYRTYDNFGGDCTNFASQILHAGGINLSKIWTPYSNAWLRVEELYSYLIAQQLGTTILQSTSLTRGSLIQFYSTTLQRFSHTGFITYELPDDDYLYCCHSYNKLNYPLSQIYPIIYPTIRGICLN